LNQFHRFIAKIKTKLYFDNVEKQIYHAFKDKKIFMQLEELNTLYTDDGDEFELEVLNIFWTRIQLMILQLKN
jgi:hypothetical protein